MEVCMMKRFYVVLAVLALALAPNALEPNPLPETFWER
jgi:hypothetical protein